MTSANDTPELYLAPADETVATMKLPAFAGPVDRCSGSMADAYRSILRADLAIVAAPEGAQDLNQGNVGSRTSALPFREVISCSNSAFGATTSAGFSSIWSRQKRPVVRSGRHSHLRAGEAEPAARQVGALLQWPRAGTQSHLSGGHQSTPCRGRILHTRRDQVRIRQGMRRRWATRPLAGDPERSHRHRRPARVSRRLPQPVVPPESLRLLPAR